MSVRTKAAFSTALRSKTSIWPGDLVRYDINGVYIWRRGDTALEQAGKGKYLIKNTSMMSLSQMNNITQDTAHLIAAITGLPVTTVKGPDDLPAFQLGEQR